MNKTEIRDLLMEYAEGTLVAEKKAIVEEYVRQSADAHEELKNIQKVFQDLSSVEPESAPSHYFVNFLPNVRRKIDQSNSGIQQYIPSWFPVIVKPVTSIIVIVSLVALYDALTPQSKHNEMYSIISEINQANLPEVAQRISFFRNESPMTMIDGESQTKVVAEEIIASNMEYDNIVSDRQILPQLDDSQIEYILDQLPSVQ